MHSWVGYELVKVLLIFGLSLKIRDDLEDWSPDLFNLFSYMGNKKQNTKKEEADRLLTILFQKTLHSGYFAKPPFGRKANFEKMSNTILPLVILTWLRQLQEHFYKISDNKESGDWNVHGKYCAVRTKHMSKDFPLDNVHMMKANSTSLVKDESVTCIKPNGKHTKGVVKSLEEWAEKILCQDNNHYVQNMANSDNEMKKCFKRTEKYGSINSLTAIGGHDRQYFNELCSTVVSRRIFIRLQSLIAH